MDSMHSHVDVSNFQSSIIRKDCLRIGIGYLEEPYGRLLYLLFISLLLLQFTFMTGKIFVMLA